MSRNRKIAYRGCLLALALVLSYLESLVPVFLGIPGIRLGLANIVTVYTLYRLSALDACFVTAARILLATLLFGNVTTMIYSLAGAAFSLGVMLLAKRLPFLSVMGVSILGGAFHNVGQLLAAALLLNAKGVISFAAILLPVGALAGGVIGVVAGVLIRKVPLGDEDEWEEDPGEDTGDDTEDDAEYDTENDTMDDAEDGSGDAFGNDSRKA